MTRPKLLAALLAASAVVPWLAAPIPGARAGTAVRLDLQGLVDASELVLEGRVLGTEVEVDRLGRPCTRATLLVSRSLLGRADGTFDVRVPGGVLPGGAGLVLPGLPNLAPGEEVVLFLSQESSAGLRVPVGLAQGKFRLVRDAQGARTLVREGADLALLDLESGAISTAPVAASYDYAAFLAEVEAAVAQRRPLVEPPPRAGERK